MNPKYGFTLKDGSKVKRKTFGRTKSR